jgi:pimeloyl-ACP methyl ester carboxylesterase
MAESVEEAGVPLVTDDPSIVQQQPGQGCPPPLTWADVLTQFQAASEPFETSRDGVTVTGRVIGTGKPVYFLNGISATTDLFCLVTWLLRDEFRCVLLDYPAKPRSLDALSAMPLIAAEHFGDEQFDLFATSFGTLIALNLLKSESSGRIKHAVLQGPLASLRLSVAEQLMALGASFLPVEMDRLPLRRGILATNHRRWFPPIDETRWEFFASDTGRPRASTVARLARLASGHNFSGDLASINTPTLIVSSEGDANRHLAAADVLAKGLPNNRHEVLPNTGHVLFVTHPHRMANLIRPFLGDAT